MEKKKIPNAFSTFNLSIKLIQESFFQGNSNIGAAMGRESKQKVTAHKFC